MVRVIIHKLSMFKATIYESMISSRQVTHQFIMYRDEKDGSVTRFDRYDHINCVSSYLCRLKENYKQQITFICDSEEIHEQCKKYGYSILTSNPYKEKME